MKKLRENQTYKRKPKKTKQTFGKTQKTTKSLKVSDPLLDMFVFLVFPKVFRKPKKPSGKPNIPKNTKEQHKNLRENQTTKVLEGFRPTLGYGFVVVLLVFPKVFENPKNIWENQNYQRKPKKPSGKQKQTKFLKVSDPPLDMGLSLLFCWCSLKFLENKKHIRENQTYQRKPKKTQTTLGKTKKQSV